MIQFRNPSTGLIETFKGLQGKDGKSAYEYATSMGYPGSEEDFAKLMSYDAKEAIEKLLQDMAGVANIEEVTQAEYDALGNEKLSNDVMYCIKDSDDENASGGSTDIQNKIGDLSELTTIDKSSIVNAINEQNGKIAPFNITSSVLEWATNANPPSCAVILNDALKNVADKPFDISEAVLFVTGKGQRRVVTAYDYVDHTITKVRGIWDGAWKNEWADPFDKLNGKINYGNWKVFTASGNVYYRFSVSKVEILGSGVTLDSGTIPSTGKLIGYAPDTIVPVRNAYFPCTIVGGENITHCGVAKINASDGAFWVYCPTYSGRVWDINFHAEYILEG